jgi:hypothetical protein
VIEPGQLRRWKGRAGADGLFLVLEHSPFPLYTGEVLDGWTIMESGCEPCWEATEGVEAAQRTRASLTAAWYN